MLLERFFSFWRVAIKLIQQLPLSVVITIIVLRRVAVFVALLALLPRGWVVIPFGAVIIRAALVGVGLPVWLDIGAILFGMPFNLVGADSKCHS